LWITRKIPGKSCARNVDKRSHAVASHCAGKGEEFMLEGTAQVHKHIPILTSGYITAVGCRKCGQLELTTSRVRRNSTSG
jgi:hypothetical protein